MNKILLKNLKLNFYITIVTGILVFIVNKYFAIYMGMEKMGLMRVFSQVVGYLSLMDLGISNAAAYALYKPLIEKNEEKINLIISTIDFFYKRIFMVMIIMGVCFTFFLPNLIKINITTDIYIYWLLYVLNTSIGYLFAKYPILFIANQEYELVRKIQGIGKIIFQSIQIIIIIITKSFVLFIIIMILENIYNYYFLKKHYYNKYNYIKIIKDKDKSVIKSMKNLFWHKLGGLIVSNTDYIILSIYTSLDIIAVYSSYLIIHQLLLTLINIINSVINPRIGNFIAKTNNIDDIYILWRKIYSVYIFIATIFITTTYYLIQDFILLWLGKEFLLPIFTVFLILIITFLNLIRGITDSIKDAFGFFDDIYTPILEGLLNLIFSLILVQKIGLNGVIIGTVISTIVAIFLLRPILIFEKYFKKTYTIYLKDNIKLLLLSTVGILIINIILNKIGICEIKVNSWSRFIYKAVILESIICIVLFCIFLYDNSFKELINFIKKKN